MVDSDRHEYRLKSWQRGLYLVLGMGMMTIGLIFAYAMTTGNQRDGAFAGIFIMLFLVIVGLYLAALAVRSKLIIEGARIEVHYAFRERSADLSEIEGFRTISSRNGSFWQILLKEGRGNFSISRSFNDDDHLRAWFQQLTDLDERDNKVLLEKIEQDQGLGATPEDRLAALKQAKQWNMLLSGVAIAAGIGLFVGGDSLQGWCALVVAVVPVVSLYLVNKQPLLFTVFKRKSDPRTDLSIAFMVSAFALLISDQNTHFVSIGPLLPYIILVILVCGVVLFGAVRNHSQFWSVMIGVVFFTWIYGYGLVTVSDRMLDKSKGSAYMAGIAGKHTTSGKSTSYYLELEPWGPEPSTNNLSVSRADYENIFPGDAVCLELHSGALHAAWYRQVSCREYTSAPIQ